jgi:hypothetical protein
LLQLFGVPAAEYDVVGLQRRDQACDDVVDMLPPRRFAMLL